MNRKLYILLLLLCQNGFAQPIFKKTQIQATLGSIISNDSTTPFLLRSNQYGLVPVRSGIGYFNLNLKKEYDSLYATTSRKLKKFSYGYGLETHVNFGKTNQALLPVVHLKARYGVFELYGGRRREIQGLVDTLGTMGSYIWSGNALPMPKIEIAIPNYTSIMKNGLIAIKGNFAHGWFGKGDSVQNVWLHQKSFYACIGKPAWKVHLKGGFNHQVQWGGYPTKPFYDEISKQVISAYGSNFNSFVKVVSGISLNRSGVGWSNQVGVAGNEAGNRAGNHLGSIDLAIEFNFKSTRLTIYKQSVYDDGSLFYLNNISDGLYGISAYMKTDKVLNNITLEYFNSLSQGGKQYIDNTPQLRGRDNYFNNSIYLDGWVYKKQTLGIPLFLPHYDLNIPMYFEAFINNRLTGINISSNYHFQKLFIRTQIVCTNNKGSYNYSANTTQSYVFQKFSISRNHTTFSASISSNIGDLLNKSLGLQIQISKILK